MYPAEAKHAAAALHRLLDNLPVRVAYLSEIHAWNQVESVGRRQKHDTPRVLPAVARFSLDLPDAVRIYLLARKSSTSYPSSVFVLACPPHWVFCVLATQNMGEVETCSSDMSALFSDFLVPPPRDEDDMTEGRSFVVNCRAGHSLCSVLEPNRFLALAGDVQLTVVSMLLKGLRAGHCSAVRLRLSCKGGRLVGSLLGLLRGLTEATTAGAAAGAGDEHTCNAGQHETGDLIQMLGQVLGLVCSAGVGVDELKDILRELRVPSALTPPLLGALAVMARRSSNTRTERSGDREGMVGHQGGAMPSLFDFGGDGAGLVLPVVQWPFPHEYQFATWIRVEQSAASRRTKAHVVTLKTERGAGVDYYIQVPFVR